MLYNVTHATVRNSQKGDIMARPGITKAEVFAAAKRLVQENKDPTIELIRQITKTGSHSTIGMHLRDWRAMQSDTEVLALNEGLPAELITTLKTLWQRVSILAHEKTEALAALSKAKIESLEQDLLKYKTNNQRWQQLFVQWQQEKDQLVAEKTQVAETHDVLQHEMKSLQSKHQYQTEQLQEKQNRIEELMRLHANAQANLEHYRESVREQRLLQEEQHNQWRQETASEIKMLKEQLTNQRDRAENAERASQLLKMEHKNLATQSANLQLSFDTLQQKMNGLTQENIKNQTAAAHWQAEYQTQSNALESAKTALMEKQFEMKTLAEKLSACEVSLHELTQQNNLLMQEENRLEQIIKQRTLKNEIEHAT